MMLEDLDLSDDGVDTLSEEVLLDFLLVLLKKIQCFLVLNEIKSQFYLLFPDEHLEFCLCSFLLNRGLTIS